MALLNRFKERLTAQNVFLDENTGGKGKYFKARFLQPGLVKYSFGVCVLEKDTIDKFINGFVGCPVIVGHKDVTNENAKDLSCGNICHIWYDEADGWYWGDGIIDNEEAIQKINEGYNVSCQYEITEYSNNTTNALHNGNPYDKVILNGKPEHLAIVDRPRYENAMIAMNALDLSAKNEEKWITIHPNGEDGKGRPLLIKDGETVKEAVERKIAEWDAKKEEEKNEPKQLGLRGFSKLKKELEKDQKELEKKDLKEKNAIRKKINDLREAYDVFIENYTPSKDWAKEKEYRDYRADLADKMDKAEREAREKYNLDDDSLEDFLNEVQKEEQVKKEEKKEDKKYTWKDKEYSLEELVHEGFNPIEYSSSIYKEDKQRKYIEKTEGSKSYRLPVSDEDFKKVGEYKQQREAKKLQQDKEKSKDLTDYIKWQYSADIEPHITGYVNNKTLVEWDKLPRETQSALKRLDFDNKINLEQYSGSEMSIAVKDKKIFDSLKKHKESKAKNCIVQAINEIKETDMFKKLFNRKDNQMEKDEMKSLFIECLQECLKAKNEEDEKDEEDKKEEEKEAENKCKNEAVDKRDIIRQIMAIAGKEEASEDVKTIAKLAEKLAYDKSEADDKADNCKGKNEEEDKKEDEEKKEEAKNKAKNAIDEMKALFSQSEVKKAASSYVSRDDAIALGNELF